MDARFDDASADRIVIRLDEAHGRSLHGFVTRMGLSADEAARRSEMGHKPAERDV